MSSALSISIDRVKVKRWFGAAQALLGIGPQTLHANVSRGRLRARPDPADPRKRLYGADDIERLRLRLRRDGRRPAAVVAAQTVRWGEPLPDAGRPRCWP